MNDVWFCEINSGRTTSIFSDLCNDLRYSFINYVVACDRSEISFFSFFWLFWVLLRCKSCLLSFYWTQLNTCAICVFFEAICVLYCYTLIHYQIVFIFFWFQYIRWSRRTRSYFCWWSAILFHRDTNKRAFRILWVWQIHFFWFSVDKSIFKLRKVFWA